MSIDYDSDIEEYTADDDDDVGFIQNTTNKFNNLSTEQQVAVGVAGVAAVAGVTAAGVGISNAVKAKKESKQEETTRELPQQETPSKYMGGFNGKWRSTFEGDTLAVLDVTDDKNGHLRISGFLGGTTTGTYLRKKGDQQIAKILFMDADEDWPVEGQVKGAKETVILWGDGTRWDKIA